MQIDILKRLVTPRNIEKRSGDFQYYGRDENTT